MRRCYEIRAFRPLLALTILAVAGPVEAQARRDFLNGMNTGVGYSAVFPDVVAGAGAWHFFGSSRIGIFADAKMSVPSLRDDPMHCPPGLDVCTVEFVETQRNDLFIRDNDEYQIVNAGGMYAITGEFALMLGAGAVRARSVREYFDESEEPITETGQFFVDHSPDPSTEIQAVVGMLIRAGGHLVFRFGYETAPGGMSVGGYFALP